MQNEQEISYNGVKATIRETANGELELTGDEFIQQLLAIGFRLGRNDTPERLAEIMKHVPLEHRQAFMDGVHGK